MIDKPPYLIHGTLIGADDNFLVLQGMNKDKYIISIKYLVYVTLRDK
jgi:hypothetical protein